MRLDGELIEQYRLLHRQKPKRYSRGSTVRRYVDEITKIMSEIPTASILDYGSGSGDQYRIDRLHEAWGGPEPTLFDPAVPGIDNLPDGQFDGVICTGVLEHVPMDEIDAALSNLARYARKWAFIVIGTGPSPHKRLPDGRDVHVTIKPPEWWRKRVDAMFSGSSVRIWLGFIAS